MNFVLFLLAFFLGISFLSPLKINAQWIQTNGPYGSNINDLTSIGKNIFVCSDFNVYRSTDNGNSWVTVNQNKGGKIIAAKDSKLFLARGNVYLSSDSGVTWNDAINGIPSDGYVTSFALTNKSLFAGVAGNMLMFPPYGIYRSIDDGVYWTQMGLQNLLITSISVNVNSSGNPDIFAGTDGGEISAYSSPGIFLSTDNGKSWNTLGLGGLVYSILEVNGAEGEEILLVGTNSGFFRSINRGNWETLSSKVSDSVVTALAAKYDEYGSTNIFAGTLGGNIFRSTNYGEDWSEVGTGLLRGLSGSIVNSIKIFENDVFAITSIGLFRSTDNGSSWELLTEGMPFLWVTSLAVYSDGKGEESIFAGTHNSGIFRSTDNGSHWIPANNGIKSAEINLLSANGKNIYACCPKGVYISTDAGDNWVQINNNLTDLRIYSFAASDSNLFLGCDPDRIYRSSDNGVSWNQVHVGTTWNSPINCIAISGKNVVAGSNNGTFCSTNNGVSWNQVGPGLPYSGPTAFIFSGTDLFAATNGGGVYKSTDYGSTWEHANKGLTHAAFSSFAVSGKNLFLGGGGVFLSTNNGENWIQIDSTLTASCLAVSSSNIFTIGASDAISVIHSGGVWRRPLSEVTGNEERFNNLPKKYLLFQNYPNPFNPSTVINYQLPENAFVILKVYDILGREIETLVNKLESTGNHSVTFSAGDLPSSIYFYRLQAGSFSEIRKMILLR